MELISHRGFWKSSEEKNTSIAIERTFLRGYGTETDVRDLAGQLVISHDPPSHESLRAEWLFEKYAKLSPTVTLAINIKADGLQRELIRLTRLWGVSNYFLFDMSVPDLVQSLNMGIPCFTRQSELEPRPVLYEACSGLWLDGFESEWYTETVVTQHLLAKKRVCIVSPELHGRKPDALWDSLKNWGCIDDEGLILCTDLLDQAISYFK